MENKTSKMPSKEIILSDKVTLNNLFNIFDFNCINIISNRTLYILENNAKIRTLSKCDILIEGCKIIIDSFEVIKDIIRSSLVNVKMRNCDIFIKNMDLNNLLFNSNLGDFNKCNFFIFNCNFECNNDTVPALSRLLDISKSHNDRFVMGNLNALFKYYPEDFSFFTETIKRIKIESISFGFIYDSRSKSEIPSLINFSQNLVGLSMKNVILKGKNIPYCESIFAESCTGSFFTLAREINLDRCSCIGVGCFGGTTINISNNTNCKISCNGKFNLYFDAPMHYKEDDIEVLTGTIKSTNKKSLLRERSSIFKYRIFIDEDFSEDSKITKFYKCKFMNCCFNLNQYLLDCEFKKCFFTEGEEFVINS